ncbi:MAG: hypothetical protein QF793_00795 [Candidatus Peribacteraceae bacterium]|jgi:hypothetical protein|nr:hypothetical protein [bacterium]MDP6561444.1 hypothetical protein [Candidatus Peribacteraceae bacterium]|tara:strand:+ start:16012 stop:16902 length:891 start_codon:yes stop_codon:yes gene_type:complete
MKTSILALVLFALPLPASAQQIGFLVEEVYASSEPVIEEDVSGLSGAAARRYREKLQQQYQQEAASSEAIIEETVTSPPAEVQEPSDISDSSAFSESSSSEPEPYFEPKPKPKPFVPPTPPIDQAAQDELTLEQLEEYANEVETNLEEQLELLAEGFSVTSTSSLGSPLPAAQRTAILRRAVRTVPQLKLFARALAESDAHLRKVEVSEGAVIISYRMKAWLFGFIPFNYILETSIEDNTVTANQPWWHAVSRDNVDRYVAAMQAELNGLGEQSEESILNRIQQTMRMIKTVLAES